QRAVTLHREVGNPQGEAEAWDSLGYAHHHLGRHESAVACYRGALDLFHAVGDRCSEALALSSLGDTLDAAGDAGAARDAWRRALHPLDQLGHPDAEAIRARLAAHWR